MDNIKRGVVVIRDAQGRTLSKHQAVFEIYLVDGEEWLDLISRPTFTPVRSEPIFIIYEFANRQQAFGPVHVVAGTDVILSGNLPHNRAPNAQPAPVYD